MSNDVTDGTENWGFPTARTLVTYNNLYWNLTSNICPLKPGRLSSVDSVMGGRQAGKQWHYFVELNAPQLSI